MSLLLITLLSFIVPDSTTFRLQSGDLIFQESCSEGVGDAIKEVTWSMDSDYRFTHVGMVYINANNEVFVIEATNPCVKVTPLYDYLYSKEEDKDCYPRSAVGRLKKAYRHLIPKAIGEGLKLVGKEYDFGYVLNNDKYYCSELVYDILLKANAGEPVFDLNVMTFKSSETGEYTQGWINYFEKHQLPIPEGEPGINPGAMSRSKVIDMIYFYK